jgi:hypothetical protein
MNTLNLPRVFPGFLALLLGAQLTFAQSLIINTPSTDVTAEKKRYAEFDFITHPESYRNGGFQTYSLRTLYGIRNGMEVGLNMSITALGGLPQPLELQPNAKWQMYSNQDYGLNVVVGGILYVPVTHRQGTDTFAMSYSTVSKKFNSETGPRVTGGFYELLVAKDEIGTRSGAILAYEQPLTKRVTVAGDWYSGRNRFGYVGGGLIITVSKTNTLVVGYSVGNHGHKNNALSIFYGVTF